MRAALFLYNAVMKAKRVAAGLALFAAAGMLAASLALWLFLGRWVPRDGKAWLIEELDRRLPIAVSIGAMRYGLFRGLTLEDVRVVHRKTQEPWCVLPSLRLHISRLALLRRHIAFSGRVAVETPCPTHVTLIGAYALGDHSLRVDAQTEDILLRAVTQPLARHLPSALTDGAVRLRLHLLQTPQASLELTGRVTGTGLVWTAPGWRMSGDLMLDGSAIPPAHADGRWAIHAQTHLAHGTLEGLQAAGSVTRMEGTARLTEDGLEIEALSGTLLDSPWQLGGTLTFKPATVQMQLTARQQLAPLAAIFPALAKEWHPEGIAALRTVCRGALEPPRLLDCLSHAEVRDAALTGGKLIAPLTDIRGTLDVDLLARRLSIASLTARLGGERLTLQGEAGLRAPMPLRLHATGRLPLEALLPWLNAGTPLSELTGTADVDLHVDGPAGQAPPIGTIELHNTTAALNAPSLAIERLNASVELTPETIEVHEAAMTLNGHPFALQGSMTRTADAELSAVARVPEGELQLRGRLSPEDLVLEQGLLSLAQSRVSVQGRVARESRRPSAVAFAGTIELSELTSVPFLPLPALEPWALRGTADVQGEFRGRFDDWQAASIRGRIRAGHLEARHLPLEQLVCTIEQHERVLRAQIPSALFAEGKLMGELTITHTAPARQDVLVQADLIGMALDRLTQAIPAWRNRSVTGRASAHATLSGTWQARHSWTGEGWLKGEGEQLGDVPLLDHIFRGLFGVLADRFGLDMLRRAQITSMTGRWQLTQERIRTDDLRLGGRAGAEPVSIYAKGSVGLDRTLDFVIEPDLSEGVVLEAPTTSTLARTVLRAAGQLERLRQLIGRHRLTGTLNEPVYRFEFSTREIFKQLAPTSADLFQNLLDVVR